MKARMVLLWGTLAGWSASAGAAGVLCPPGHFTVRSTSGITPFTELFVDPTAKQISSGGIPASEVRVHRKEGAIRIHARWSALGAIRGVAVVLRSDEADCDALAGRAKVNRRALRRVLGAPLPEGLPTHGMFSAERLVETGAPVEPHCSNAAGGPSVATLALAPGGDLDLGWTGLFHDRGVAGGRIALCLDGCDASTESVCRATAASEVPYGPPVPVLAGGLPLCLVPSVFGSTQTGRIDLATGEMELPIRIGVGVHVTSSNAVCPRCEAGSCTEGLAAGASCSVDAQTVVHGLDGVDAIYRLSGDCLPGPSDLVGEIPIDLGLTTETTSLAGSPPCFAESAPPPPDDACGAAGCGGSCSDGSDAGAVCCVDLPDRSCFPTRDGGSITRTGERNAPSAAGGGPWPDPVYPKHGDATVVAVSCAGSSGSTTVDATVGLPGPVALRLPVGLTVEQGVSASSESAR